LDSWDRSKSVDGYGDEERLIFASAIEYLSATTAGLMRPLSLDEWNDMDRDWVSSLWDAWTVLQERQDGEQGIVPPLTADEEMQQSLMNLMQRG
jgi:hypothetical protein